MKLIILAIIGLSCFLLKYLANDVIAKVVLGIIGWIIEITVWIGIYRTYFRKKKPIRRG
jgi:ABC-type uncharacterized transport system permease subunit